MSATLVVNADNRVLWIGDEARTALAGLDVLRIEEGVLSVGDRAVDRELRSTIERAQHNEISSDLTVAVPILRPKRLPVILYIRPSLCKVILESGGYEPVALVHLYDPLTLRKIGVPPKYFRFTKDEADLTEALLTCRSVGEACRRNGIALEVGVRLVKGIYAKTGVKSRTGLGRLFAFGEAPIGLDL